MNLKKNINSLVYVSFKENNKNKITLKLMQINVPFYDIESINDQVRVKIRYTDYAKVKKYLISLNPRIEEVTGFLKIIETIRKYQIIVAALACSFLFVLLSSFVIVDVDVIHDDEDLIELIYTELEEYGVKKFTFKKSYKALEKIKKQIKANNLDKIDWLEINKVGMKYVVRVEERIITNLESPPAYCHIVAKKDGLITGSQIEKGELKIATNDYVKKGDILISGDITLNEESVEKVCASGSVYAEVWFNVNIKLPLKYYEEVKTGKSRNNLVFNYDGVDRKLFKDRLDDYTSNKKLFFDALGLKIYLQKDYEIRKIAKEYSVKEAEEKALQMALEKTKLSLKAGDEIIDEKVLQKTVNDSTISIDIFIVAHEQIGTQVEAKEEVKDDS